MSGSLFQDVGQPLPRCRAASSKMSGSLFQDVAYFSQDDSRHFSKSKVKKTIIPIGKNRL